MAEVNLAEIKFGGAVGDRQTAKLNSLPNFPAIRYRKYFNQNLLDVDGRFSRDLDYLFVTQYIVEARQVEARELLLYSFNNTNIFPISGEIRLAILIYLSLLDAKYS